jgi:hypothetical protein
MARRQKLPQVKVQKYEATLKVVLTPEEIADRADRAAQKVAERDSKEEDMKAAAKHAKAEIEKLDAEFRFLSNEVRTRSTYRPVECERRYDYRALRVLEMRTDTGEQLADRKMTEVEKQRELFEEQAEGDAGADQEQET